MNWDACFGGRTGNVTTKIKKRIQNSRITWEEGCKHLSKSDKILKQLISRIGNCELQPQRRKFHGLARAIVYQQLSGKAAGTIMSRVLDAAGAQELTHKMVNKLTDKKLRNSGLSERKVEYLRGLARAVTSGDIDFDELDHVDDDEHIVERLTSLKGIGRWTAEMYLIFDLGRPDVMPLNDLAITKTICELYKIKEAKFTAKIDKLSSPWRPYRSIACWYFWKNTNLSRTPGQG
jgi:DNA-3-methyladenine glycosylase II